MGVHKRLNPRNQFFGFVIVFEIHGYLPFTYI